MSTISQYAFTSTFNTDKLTTRQIVEMGAQTYTVTAADTDGDGELSFEEIVANTELCDKIIEYMKCIKNEIYDIYLINEALFEYDERLLGNL